MTDTVNLALGVAWAGIMLASYTILLRRDIEAIRQYRDGRNIRALLTSFAEWLTAVLFSAALLASVFIDMGSVGVTIRSLLFTMGLGAFTGRGVLAVLEKQK